jgi:hypothetical protein
MVTIVKHEWHQHDRQYAIELDEALLSEIYPDLDDDEISQKLADIESGELDYEEVLDDANENDVEIEWDFQYDDCWTDRKGGYEVTYELGDADSWHTEPAPPEPTHKCTKCKWVGQGYDAEWSWEDKDGTEIDDPRKICPMCDSDTELTEAGIKDKKESDERSARWAKEAAEEEEEVPCFSCGAMHKESELPELSGQYHCPSCHEGWVMMDMREEEPVDVAELEAALEELKREFENLSVQDDEELNEVKKPVAEWPFKNGEITDASVSDTEVLPNYPAGEYTIRIWGRTREIGVGKINKQQYEHWSHEDHEDDLSDAMNESYDYDENDTPKKARFDNPYYEYQDVHSFWGFDEDDTHMTITNESGEEIYQGDLSSFIVEAHGDNDSRWDATEEVEELYPHNLGKGYFVMWTQGGKGSCIQTTIDTDGEEFDPRKLTYTTWDVDGSSCVNQLVYDNIQLDDYGMDTEHDNWRGQWSQFNVYHNKK